MRKCRVIVQFRALELVPITSYQIMGIDLEFASIDGIFRSWMLAIDHFLV